MSGSIAMKVFLSLAAIVFLLLLWLPLFQSATGWPPDHPPAGVENTVPLPTPGWTAWWDGSLQSDFDTWLNQCIGLRGLLVRTANQINYSLFRELARGRGTQVLPGRDGFLYEKNYVDTYRNPGQAPEEDLRSVSAALRRLQNRLEADGIAFLLVIAPSKAEIYPEHLPGHADVAGRFSRRSNYENMRGILSRDGVNVLDAHELFLEWKREPGAPQLFTQGGTHWNHYGTARVVSVLIDRLRRLTGQDLPSIQVIGSETNDRIVGADNDLGKLANLWSDRRLAGPQTHPVRERHPGTYLADALFVSDSFGTKLTDIMNGGKLYRRQDTYYYYSRHFFWPRPRTPGVDLEKLKLDLLQEVQGRDAVVIVEVETFLPQIGFGFVEDLLAAYDALDAARAREPAF